MYVCLRLSDDDDDDDASKTQIIPPRPLFGIRSRRNLIDVLSVSIADPRRRPRQREIGRREDSGNFETHIAR